MILFLKMLRFNDINLVIHNRPFNFRYFSKGYIWSLIIRNCVKNITTVSFQNKSYLKFYFPNISVIYNGIKDINHKKYIKEIPYIRNSSKKLKLLVIASLNPLKRTGESLQELISVSEDYDLTWAGPVDIKYKNKILGNTKSDDNINFLGFVKDVNNLILENDIVFIPSKTFESFSMVFLEAIMNKRPCICYENIGAAECINNNVDGWVICDKSFNLLNKLNEIKNISKPNLLDISNNCRKNFIKNFTNDKMLEEYQKLFSKSYK